MTTVTSLMTSLKPTSDVGLGADAGNDGRHQRPLPTLDVDRILGVRRVGKAEEHVERIRRRRRHRRGRNGVSARPRFRSRHLDDVDRSSPILPALDPERDGRVLLFSERAGVLGRRKRFVDLGSVDRIDAGSCQ